MIFKFGRTKLELDSDPVVRSFIRHHIPCPERFVSRIDAEDEMFLFDLQADPEGDRRRNAIGYYSVGSRIFGAIQQIGAWHFKRLTEVGSFLDFASGYGRSTRFLVQELAPNRVWACDIYPKAVDFQKRHYGVQGIVSVPDPTDFPKDTQFDFIFASSFFTHMPESTFYRWMETLYGLLTERGILVFSTHDAAKLPPSVPLPPSGILFIASSESRTLDSNQYGSCYVDQQFVPRVVDSVTRGKAHLHRIERGLDRFQDIYILAKNLNKDFSDLNFVHDPGGCFDRGELSADGSVNLNGWAADINVGASIKEVQFLTNDRLISSVVPSYDRPDVAAFFQRPAVLRSGWSCNLKRGLIRSNDIVEINVVNDKGRSRVIAYDYLKSMVRRARAAG